MRDRTSQTLFATYLAIGGGTFVVYLTVFSILQSHGIPLPVASSIAYFTTPPVHFILNRYFNFRRFDRSLHDQARTYLVVIAVQWLVTLAIVDVLSAHGVHPTIAAILAVAVNVPCGFLANRYLTFGVGIVPRLLRLRKVTK